MTPEESVEDEAEKLAAMLEHVVLSLLAPSHSWQTMPKATILHYTRVHAAPF